jgi:alkylation response protein AidB-like acyl-CoA dehydrogenase
MTRTDEADPMADDPAVRDALAMLRAALHASASARGEVLKGFAVTYVTETADDYFDGGFVGLLDDEQDNTLSLMFNFLADVIDGTRTYGEFPEMSRRQS